MFSFLDRELAKHGELLPLWVRYPYHPFDIGWRMGEGESYVMMYWDWFHETFNKDDGEQALEYFRRYLPIPGEWLPMVAGALGDFDDVNEYGMLLPEESEEAFQNPEVFRGVRWLAQNGLCNFDSFVEFMRGEMVKLLEEEEN